MDCVFCKIIKGDIPCDKVYEDEKVLAFLDIHPVSKGHALVVPKKHVEDFLSADDQLLSEIIIKVREIASKIIINNSADGFNLSVNNGSAAHQIVPHLHFHIVPRYLNDNSHFGMNKNNL